MSHGYLWIPGVSGECEERNHKDWIEITSFNHGIRQANVLNGYQGPFGPGGAEVDEFTTETVLNKAVPLLAQYCCEGKPFDDIKIDLCAAVGEHRPYMQYTLIDAVISSVQYSGTLDHAVQRPSVSLSFTFSMIEWEYTQIDSKGKASAPVRASYDCRVLGA